MQRLPDLQGNCSDPDAAGALGLPADLAEELLPLKPFQCLLVVGEPWLMVNKGSVWVSNVYLKSWRHTVRPHFAFISVSVPVRTGSQCEVHTLTCMQLLF